MAAVIICVGEYRQLRTRTSRRRIEAAAPAAANTQAEARAAEPPAAAAPTSTSAPAPTSTSTSTRRRRKNLRRERRRIFGGEAAVVKGSNGSTSRRGSSSGSRSVCSISVRQKFVVVVVAAVAATMMMMMMMMTTTTTATTTTTTTTGIILRGVANSRCLRSCSSSSSSMITVRSKNHWIGSSSCRSSSSCGISSRPGPSVAGGGAGGGGAAGVVRGVHAFAPTVHWFPPSSPHVLTMPRIAAASTSTIRRNISLNQSGRNGRRQQHQQQNQRRRSSSFFSRGLVLNHDETKMHRRRKMYGWGETTSAAALRTILSSSYSSSSSSSTTTMLETTNWRTHPTINPTLHFRTLRVPIRDVAFWLKHPKLQPYFAYHHHHHPRDGDNHNIQNQTNDDDDDDIDDDDGTVSNAAATITTTILSHIHPRLKIVQDDEADDFNDGCTIEGSVENEPKPPGGPTHKFLLLWMVEKDDDVVDDVVDSRNSSSSSSSRNSELEQKVQSIIDEINSSSGEKKGSRAASFGPIKSIPITYQNLSYGYILRQLLIPSSKSSKQEEEQEESSSSSSIDVTSIHHIPTSYEQVGHVAHFNLRKHHLPYRKLIGEVLLESATGRGGSSGTGDGGGRITTVVNKVGQVHGKFRTFDYEVLATSKKTNEGIGGSGGGGGDENDPTLLETTVVEDGIKIHLNLAECYWCTRLSGERQTLINDILGSDENVLSEIPHDLVIADVFCGVGAVCLLLAKEFEQRVSKTIENENTPIHNRTMTIVANDWNEKAIKYFNQSIVSNKFRFSGDDNGKNVKSKDRSSSFELHSQESYEFLIQLGTSTSSKQSTKAGRTKFKKISTPTSSSNQRKYPHHVLMNFPLEAPKFLGALRWWSSKRIQEQYKEDGMYPRFHIYTFARPTRINLPDSVIDLDDEEEVAVDLIADSMLPSMDFQVYDDDEDNDAKEGSYADQDNMDDEDGYILDDEDEASIFEHRRSELNNVFGANVTTRLVRDVAPGKVVVCVSFSVTPKLVRYMQGNYW
eukprot:CAMPEP_0113486056 /NCGR_PEP_ID=MMETSP0014_2-20120614/24800_1 /TAXON_ID=2857 /ORGANISM="Nitzschia sp." /LENGTH=1018 /DNA_ID=CAMNT_0000379717 /DNA_START=141 /DNA_END=3194 /DNA_ORIENTATION=+ /assembly_acc=CAM_ASM_000159